MGTHVAQEDGIWRVDIWFPTSDLCLLTAGAPPRTQPARFARERNGAEKPASGFPAPFRSCRPSVDLGCALIGAEVVDTRTPPMWEANDARHFDMAITFG